MYHFNQSGYPNFWKHIKITNMIKRIFLSFLNRTARIWPDKLYLKIIFRLRVGYKLNLKNPRTFNEKLQYLKLYDRNPLYQELVDKYDVKQWVLNTCGGGINTDIRSVGFSRRY